MFEVTVKVYLAAKAPNTHTKFPCLLCQCVGGSIQEFLVFVPSTVQTIRLENCNICGFYWRTKIGDESLVSALAGDF